jgi:predicted ATPase
MTILVELDNICRAYYQVSGLVANAIFMDKAKHDELAKALHAPGDHVKKVVARSMNYQPHIGDMRVFIVDEIDFLNVARLL